MNTEPNRPQNTADWEKTLREGSFDLPEATWQRMENDLRAFLAERSREAARPTRAPWYEGLLRWASAPALRWGAAAASLLLVGTTVVVLRGLSGTGSDFDWAPGQVLEAQGRTTWEWNAGRCRIQGEGAKLALRAASDRDIRIELERGQATFQVEHRRPDESFSVQVGDCQVQVVGTTFTVGIDSLRRWVSVEDGKVRFQDARGQRLVEARQSSVCGEWANASTPVVAQAVEPPSVPDAGPAVVAPAVTQAAKTEIVVPTCVAGDACIAILSDFARRHPDHPAVAEVALRWARLAAAKGDHRDALVAYGLALEKGRAAAPLVRLEWYRTKVHGLGQTAEVSDSLDRWIASLPPAGAIWREAVGLRREVARRLGDEATAKRLDASLSSAPRAETGGP